MQLNSAISSPNNKHSATLTCVLVNKRPDTTFLAIANATVLARNVNGTKENRIMASNIGCLDSHADWYTPKVEQDFAGRLGRPIAAHAP